MKKSYWFLILFRIVKRFTIDSTERFFFLARIRNRRQIALNNLNGRDSEYVFFFFSKMEKRKQLVHTKKWKRKVSLRRELHVNSILRRKDVKRAVRVAVFVIVEQQKQQQNSRAAAATTNWAKWTFYTKKKHFFFVRFVRLFHSFRVFLFSLPLVRRCCAIVCGASFLRLHDFGVTDGRVAHIYE